MVDEKVKSMGMDDSNVSTRLLEKNYSPMIIRRYNVMGWAMFVSMICDESLSDLDKVVYKTIDECKQKNMLINDLQSLRNVCGFLSDKLVEHYDGVKKGCVESVAVIWSIDKGMISSLWGDAMQHAQCRNELYFLLNMMTQV